MARIAILLGAIVVCCGVSAENILDEIGKRPNLSQVRNFIDFFGCFEARKKKSIHINKFHRPMSFS